MSFAHGKATVFKIDNAADSLTDISAYLTDVDFPRSVKSAETTTFGAASDTFIAGTKGATFSISGLFDATADAVLDGILGLIGDFEYGPTGSTAGMVKYTGDALCTGYSIKGAIGGAIQATATFQCTGDITRGTY